MSKLFVTGLACRSFKGCIFDVDPGTQRDHWRLFLALGNSGHLQYIAMTVVRVLNVFLFIPY